MNAGIFYLKRYSPVGVSLWEQSLLAMNDNAVIRQTEMPSSRASFAPTGSLPQG